ncbi:MAG: fibronectin type III domain-containing protein, partial [Prevotellaceae bacterium]|nr:fibronectin type III domain-containing protein [Prevotellaceae bacterium]
MKCVKLFLLHLVFLLSAFAAAGQTYPVLGNVYIIPPYGAHLTDYYATSREKLVVTLLNRDQQEPVLQACLRMTITSTTGLRIQNRPEINYPTITLDAGIPVRLSQEDLTPYFLPQNLIQQGYLNQGKLPNGMIEFTFQAIEKYTGKVLSAPATGRIWLTTQKPPLLVLPNRDENIAFREPLNLKFQWQPQHSNISQIEYEFELRELPPNGAAPQSAFLYSPIIYQERLFYTSLLYSAVFPPLDANKTYGWRVRAIAKDGVDELNIFENNGYSEIHWFRTNAGCEPPIINYNVHDYQLDLTWNAIDGSNEYEVQFCNKYEGTGILQKYRTADTKYTFYSLQRGSTYQYRVGAECTNGNLVYSSLFEFTVPEYDSARMANCGVLPKADLSNREPLQELKVGDVFMASDYLVTVTKISGSNGVFTGEGWIMLRWIFNVRVAVEFENIPINTDKRAVGGIINFKYSKDWKNIANLDNYSDGGKSNTANGIIRPDYT